MSELSLSFPPAESSFFQDNTFHVTSTICLTPFLNTDVPALVYIHAISPDIERFTNNIQKPYTDKDATEFLLRAQQDLIHKRTGTCLKFAIRNSRTMELVGLLNVFRSFKYGPDHEGWWSLGYALSAELTGRGIATACVKCALTGVGQRLGVRWWECQAIAGNWASRRVLEKCGFLLVEEAAGGINKKSRDSDGNVRVESVDAWFFEKKQE